MLFLAQIPVPDMTNVWDKYGPTGAVMLVLATLLGLVVRHLIKRSDDDRKENTANLAKVVESFAADRKENTANLVKVIDAFKEDSKEDRAQITTAFEKSRTEGAAHFEKLREEIRAACKFSGYCAYQQPRRPPESNEK